MPTPTTTTQAPAPPLPPALPVPIDTPIYGLVQASSPPPPLPPVGPIGSYLPSSSPLIPYVIPGFPVAISPPLPPPLPPASCPTGFIQIRIDNEWIPIQSGTSGSHTTAWLSINDLPPDTYTILFHGRRDDQSEKIYYFSLVVENPVQPNWNLPQIDISTPSKQLPAGYVGKEYSDLKYATLTTGSPDELNQLVFTAVTGGTIGNLITIAFVVNKDINGVALKNQTLVVVVSGLNIKVTLATDVYGSIVTTSGDVKNAIRNNPVASNLVAVVVMGSGGFVDAFDKKNLSGGAPASTLLVASDFGVTTGQGFCEDILSPPSPPTSSATTGTWSVTPGLYGTSGLPPGLNIDAATGAIFGIPTQVGDYLVSIHLTDSQGYQVTKQIPITIFSDRPPGEVLPTETRVLGPTIYPDEPTIYGSLITPLPDQVSQDLSPLMDLKRTYWSPVPLAGTLVSDSTITSFIATLGQLSTAIIQFEAPLGPGPWTEVRFSFYTYKDSGNPNNTPDLGDFKVVLAIIPMSGGVILRDTVEKTTLPLDYDNTYLHQFVWRGLWFQGELSRLSIRFEPRVSLPIDDIRLGKNYILLSGLTATLRSIPLPDVSLAASILLSGRPISSIQLTPTLSDQLETYELTWVGHWTQDELEEVSLVLETRVKSEEMDSDAAIPWIMVSNLELETDPEPLPAVPIILGPITNLLTVVVTPNGAADLVDYIFLVNITSNGYDGWVIPSISWLNTNPGINAVFDNDRISITNGSTVTINLTVTSGSAAVGSVAYFVVVGAASTGAGSGTSEQISFIVANAPLSALTVPPSLTGSTQIFVDVIPKVAEIPKYGFTSFAVKVTAPLGTTTVTLSVGVRPSLSSIQTAFTATAVQPAPGFPVTVQLQVQVGDVPEQTYSLDILALGGDGGYAGTQAVLVVMGQPAVPVPLPPPLPVIPPAVSPGLVDTLVPDGVVSQTGNISGTWNEINSGVVDPPAPATASCVQFMFGPQPLTSVCAVNYSMTDSKYDGIWTQLVIRVTAQVLNNVQNPVFSFQPFINDLPVGSPKNISTQDGLSINIQNFPWTWQGQWLTSDINTLYVQISAYTAGPQTEVNSIVLTELDAVISGSIRNPLPTSVPVHLAPNSSIFISGNTWDYSTLNLISAINQDTDCATDQDYATVTLVNGDVSEQEFGFEDPPILGTWYDITIRVRAQATDGQPQMAVDFTIQDVTVVGTAGSMTVGGFTTYPFVYKGIYTNSDIAGMTVNITLTNVGTKDTTILVSGVDIVVQGVAAALEQIKIVPFYELQFYGSHQGTVADIWEGSEEPPDASLDPNLPLVAAGDFYTSPDPLPKPFTSEEDGDKDYEIFPLTYDQRSTIIEYGFSDPAPVPPMLLPPSPPGSPPSSPPVGPPSPPIVEEYFTSISVRMRLHQDPRTDPPTIINVPVLPPFGLVGPKTLPTLPPAVVDMPFPDSSGKPYQFQVTGGQPPYHWFIKPVAPDGNNIEGVPPNIQAYQDADSAFFDYIGTPINVAMYQFVITVSDSGGRSLFLPLTHDIIAPSPPPGPPAVSPPTVLPPGPVGSPPPPVVSPPSPPVLDMFLWVPSYTVGIDSFTANADPGTIWVGPNVDIKKLEPDPFGRDYRNVSQVQFDTSPETKEVSGGTLTELAGYSRTGFTWTSKVVSNTYGANVGPTVVITGVPSSKPAPTAISAMGTGTDQGIEGFIVRLSYNGVPSKPDSGTVEIDVTGIPGPAGLGNTTGKATGTIYWGYLSPLVIITLTVPNGVIYVGYTDSVTAVGGVQPYTWYTIGLPTPPPGISFDAGGHFTGAPTAAGSFTFTVGVKDASTPPQVAQATYTINVSAVSPPPPAPPPPPVVVGPPSPPTVSPPLPPGAPGPPIFSVDTVPGIEVRYQPLVPDKCSGTIAGLGSILINDYLILRPANGSTDPVSAGPWVDFSHTWFGFWTSSQLSELMVELQFTLVDPISVGAANNLYISALDVVVTKAVPPSIGPWLASDRPEGRIKWMSARVSPDTGPNSGKWLDGDVLSWRDPAASYMSSILGTAHKGGQDPASADSVVDRYEILGWLDRDGDETANASDTPVFTGYVALATSIGILDTTILVTNISTLKDPLDKYFLGFLVDDELIVVQRDQIDYETGLLHNVWRGVNETQESSHTKGTLVFPVNFWELMYRIKIASATGSDFKGHAVGWDTPPGTDNDTPGELLQDRGHPLDLRPFSGEHPIRWLLRLRVYDVYGLTTDSNMTLPGFPDEFRSTGPQAYMGSLGNVYVPSKRLLYVKQIRPPGKPNIFGSGV